MGTVILELMLDDDSHGRLRVKGNNNNKWNGTTVFAMRISAFFIVSGRAAAAAAVHRCPRDAHLS